MDLSIIIPSYNTKKLLDRCLTSISDSLKDSSLAWEIIVVDNASTDGTIELLNKKYPRVIKIFKKSNLGYGKSNNLGIQKAKGTYILLLNSDTVVLENAIELLYKASKIHPRSFIGGKLFNEDKTPQASCGPMYTLPVVFLMLFAKGDTLGLTRYSPHQAVNVDWVSGACIFASKQNFLEAGLFDEEIFLYMEEIDFLYRAHQKGYTTLFYPEAQFVHTGAASSGSRKEPVKQIYKGLLYFYGKHRSIIELWVLRYMLRTKAVLAWAIGHVTRNDTLISTYEQAFGMV